MAEALSPWSPPLRSRAAIRDRSRCPADGAEPSTCWPATLAARPVELRSQVQGLNVLCTRRRLLHVMSMLFRQLASRKTAKNR